MPTSALWNSPGATAALATRCGIFYPQRTAFRWTARDHSDHLATVVGSGLDFDRAVSRGGEGAWVLCLTSGKALIGLLFCHTLMLVMALERHEAMRMGPLLGLDASMDSPSSRLAHSVYPFH